MSLPTSRGSILLLFSILISACASLPKGHFVTPSGLEPDYSLQKNWAALPEMKDSADIVPIAIWTDEQASSPVDVFFIHPTTYIGRAGQRNWNASLADEKLNQRTDASAIKYQASLFNGAGRVYAPRYRQAHLNCFYTKKKKKDAAAALALAYADVKVAFTYYLAHYNAGRPFILASHSQGTWHGAKLIREEIENHPIQDKLVVAYLPGLPVKQDYFNSVPPCKTADETGCFCSWRTFRRGCVPKKYHLEGENIAVTNPVTWNDQHRQSGKDEQVGAVLRDFTSLYPGLVETEVHEDLLWVSRPKFPWSFLLMTKNYHIADYNFFYGDVRQNAQQRVHAFLSK